MTLAVAAALGIVALATPASAQQHKPRVGTAARPAPSPPQMTVPYPGATVTVDPQLYQLWYQQNFPQRQDGQRHGRDGRPGFNVGSSVAYPVYEYYPSVYSVTDANGRPLYIPNDPGQPGQYQGGGYGMGTPDLSGSPYVAGANGAMVVNFGNGDSRTIPACAALAAERTPTGQPRTIFYQPSSGGVILRDGQRGRVLGFPPAGAKVCYTTDAYGRMALDWD